MSHRCCLLLLTAALAAVVTVTMAAYCSSDCGHTPLEQNIYCDADFVLRVKVASIYFTRFQLIYKITVVDEYKMQKDMREEVSMNFLHTLKSTAKCGVPNLRKDEEYVVSGQIINKKLSLVDVCSTILTPVTDMTPKQQSNYKRHFKENCHFCRVTISSSRDLTLPYGGEKDCTLSKLFTKCYTLQSVCEFKEGRCQWKDFNKELYSYCLYAHALPYHAGRKK